jgi:protein phosphatase
MKIVASGKCDKGNVKQDNQDALLMLPEHGLYAVADGMGGMNGGEYAARFSVDELSRAAARISFSPDSLETLLIKLSHQLWEQGTASKALFGMGAALAVMHIQGEIAIIAHAGDCRVYLLRKGSLHQLTKDETLVQDLIDRGIVTIEARRTHPWRGTLSSYMGQKALKPSVQLFTLQADDFFLICSDGLTKELEDQQIQSIMNSTLNPEEASTLLLEKALQNGGKDNITVTLLLCQNQGSK